MNLEAIKSVYFIGIGGIGMSAIARYFNTEGKEIYGYDKVASSLTKKLVEEGMTIHYDAAVEHIPTGIDLVVYTPAVGEDNVELAYFRTHDFVIKKRAAVLGMISQQKRMIAIAGTHGKTTTSTITAHLLKTGGIDCTAFLGGIANNFASNFVAGTGAWVVAEADEYDRSFLQLNPEIALVLSMDADHLDIYGNENSVRDSFKAFTKKVKPNGKVFLRNGLTINYDKNDMDTMPHRNIDFSSFGVEDGLYRAEDIKVSDGHMVFNFVNPIEQIENIRFPLPGRHNVENASAAITIALQLGISGAMIKKGLASFKGIKRRFEIVYQSAERVYVDDYAHHPVELQAAIRAAKQFFPGKKVTGIFQPHLFSRTQDFATEFAAALDELDEVLLMDIYPAREIAIPGVTSDLILKQMKQKNKRIVSKAELLSVLKTKEIEVLISLGAGDIGTFVSAIKNQLVHE
ncbi:MAG: UDP-N-acetylmuramate--L-alanine ligase [Saprospiraceae bacterium]